ncbi:MAG: Maf family nucleotide pyrophosphatase [bacterium]|nr:Maf family nucleotide pyrophosphatase [bacterium]
MIPLLLASASPRRKAILEGLGYEFKVHHVDCEEVCIADDPIATVLYNAKRKARALREVYKEAFIIAADTVVSFRGRIYGKPSSKEEARAWLTSFSGQTQTVYTAVAFVDPKAKHSEVFVEASSLRFKNYGVDTVDDYLYRVKPYDRAGAYDINAHGEILIASHTGSYSNIMGLPKKLVFAWLRSHGVHRKMQG